jgi:hypothetical protein
MFSYVLGLGAQGRNRTTDTVIFSHVLYQLSYLGAGLARRGGQRRGYSGSGQRCPHERCDAVAPPGKAAVRVRNAPLMTPAVSGAA